MLTQVVLDEVAKDHRYQPSSVGLDRLAFARSFRPTWATTVAIVFAPTGIALFCLLVRRTETFSVSIEEHRSGLAARIHGQVHPELLARLEAAVGAPGSKEPASISPPEAMPHGAGLPAAPVSEPMPSGEPSIPSPWLLSVPPASGAPPDETTRIIRGARTASPAAAPTPPAARSLALRLDDGRVVGLDRMVLVGRNPMGGADDREPELFVIDDDTISKTHAAFWYEAGVVWVTDRHSTNGTVVVTAAGEEIPALPGEPVRVDVGRRVRLGARSLVVETR